MALIQTVHLPDGDFVHFFTVSALPPEVCYEYVLCWVPWTYISELQAGDSSDSICVKIVALCSFAVSRFSLARSKTVSTSAGPRPFSNVSTRFTLCPGVFQIVDVSRPNLFLYWDVETLWVTFASSLSSRVSDCHVFGVSWSSEFRILNSGFLFVRFASEFLLLISAKTFNYPEFLGFVFSHPVMTVSFQWFWSSWVSWIITSVL